MTVEIPSPECRYWLLTMPRTASNMLVRVLNLDEQGVRPAPFNGGYFFFSSMASRLKLYNKASEWNLKDIETSLKQSFDVLQDYLEGAEKDGQKVFVKEHISFLNDISLEYEHMYGTLPGDSLPRPMPARGFAESTRSPLNQTSLPDEFLKTWYPTFLIRHPALMLSSLYRTAQADIEVYGSKRANKEPFEFEATMKFVKSLFDFYSNYFGNDSKWPIVLDADDVIMYPELVMKYAGLVGLSPEKLRFSWEKTSKEDVEKMHSAAKIMLSTINSSTGVDKGKVAGNIDIDVEAEKWRAEFGEEGGNKLEKWVRDAMPDYEYLRSRRLTV
ncbi:hypothetical protein F5B22DRAFT_598073 [Xylaria bambusicola]|uniref:uncharacterized protein n=1 Tax=Xylaria bambusicola TaxID=326684 RepID=UPI002007D785|nr:uncharacterized protein F5B22DRAFT_598073 [Xylaria bambusicola]KAI0520714.1 hypothetical protein F5B22DRAFT_598073 [Xylaria bambusicola]